ncbi:hypothetical protein, partial [Desulfosporosinus lacus]|uniref:hypothetical protein n=1 Tax=Desulfosporosinus lacus TaxID=329936 RepID=UPI001A9A45E6
RAKDTWSIAPGKVESTRQENSSWDAVWRKACPPFVSPGNKRQTISNEIVFLWFALHGHSLKGESP